MSTSTTWARDWASQRGPRDRKRLNSWPWEGHCVDAESPFGSSASFTCPVLSGEQGTMFGLVWWFSKIASVAIKGEWRRSWAGGGHPELRISTRILERREWELRTACAVESLHLATGDSGNPDFPRQDYWTTIQAEVIYIPLTALFTQPAWMQISAWKRWRRWGVQPEGTGGLVLVM